MTSRRAAWAVGLMLLLAGTARAGMTSRQAIERAYATQAEAASLRFVPGMLSIRTPDFQAFDPDGHAVDLAGERQQYQRLLEQAVQVTDAVHVLAFRPMGAERAFCQAQETLDLVQLTDCTPVLQRFTALSVDEWVLTPRGWKLRRSRVLNQTLTKPGGPPPQIKP
ncbi:MAG TPA: hypothetical protein VGO93_27240 [Candidatus Xenobia bacterium]|jgi:hypothetical protein